MNGLINEERFWAKVQPADGNGCMLWIGAVNSRGYGSFGVGGKSQLAHRVAYTLHNGPIPTGLTIDHLCHVKRCVNPLHLEAVSLAENTVRAFRDGLTPPSPLSVANAAKTHCVNGHPYVAANIYRPPSGGRVCRTCKRDSDRRRLADVSVSLRPAGGVA